MDPMTLRLIERIVSVAIGGLAIFLGYRLFLNVPTTQDSRGKFTLPWNISLVLTRVGPGVFFALYGAVIVAYALHQTVTYSHERVPAGGAGATVAEKEDFRGVGPAPGADAAVLLRTRARMVFLNQSQRTMSRDASETEKLAIKTHVTALKLATMEPVWRREAWGDQAAFRLWAEAGASDPVPSGLESAAAYFRSGQERGQ
jgi:hypothetical protein